MHGVAFLCAVIGGAIWGVGSLGRRCGVADAKLDDNRGMLSAYTLVVYSIGTLVVPGLDYLLMNSTMSRADTEEGLNDSDWLKTLPMLGLCGVFSALGGFTACYAISLADRNGSCMVAMLESGVYSVAAAVFIVLLLGEEPTIQLYVAGLFIIAGILLLHFKGGSDRLDREDVTYGAATGISSGSSQKAPFFAVLAGILWAVGIFGKRYSAASGAANSARVRANLTYVVYQVFSLIPPGIFLVYELLNGRLFAGGPGSEWFRHRAPQVLAAALVSGLGGCIVTYALAAAGPNEGALITLISDGIYTLLGAVFIALVFEEKLENFQLIGGAAIMIAVFSVHPTKIA
mmetsp:Transcript_81385/g.143657  ORF Transcript_81385/g.143657 Transcript_81385/m.143657 type:complete len:345 (-) Transcript_81385:136-1170(-)|eukprot:CAMPEP_0197654168 /NCGR_PEP_ID=MMETSP1338-20131121/38694_1 /TAXON_ID=43686 ORGANISM="Pelagodinium beii, Strain RCC1491" /NCGR_SAMPLE_ID=MMETSP1338 /ASSEMBLY_ACC=CAM_ASM_000754 /LENGTH=344 /DNA_ID=CAMNT_0043229567 /DNA_START=91 /DNA_END=1125 /DNA_ORIENTATION=-